VGGDPLDSVKNPWVVSNCRVLSGVEKVGEVFVFEQGCGKLDKSLECKDMQRKERLSSGQGQGRF